MTTSADHRSFTCFPKLPIELRLKIWKDVCHLPRYVDIWTGYHRVYKDRGEQILSAFTRHVTLCGVPAVLHTTRESRKEALEHYTLAFGSNQTLHYGIQLSIPPRIYVDWKSDIICPMAVINSRSNWHADMLEIAGIAGVSQIALNLAEWGEDDPDDLDDLNLAELCPSVKEIILYHLDTPYPQMPLPLHKGHFEFNFEEFPVAGPPEGLRARFDNMVQRIKSDHETAIRTEFSHLTGYKEKVHADDKLEEKEEALSFREEEWERYLLQRPGPVVKFMRIFVNGIDVDADRR